MSDNPAVLDDWLEIQRKYWDTWTDMSRKAWGLAQHQGGSAETFGGAATKPWEAALDHWWKAWSPAAPEAAQTFMERLMEQGKVFFRMAESFLPDAAGTGAQGGGSAVDGWGGFLKTLEDLQARFTGGLDEGGDALHRMMAFWELPYDNWQRMMSSMSPMPGDWLRNMPHEQVKGQIDRVLSAPGLGYTREEQSQYQDLIRRSMDYQAALREYLAFYAQVGVKSVERMRGYVQSVVESGKSVDSARAVYDNWVRCCEDVYAEEVATPEYARIHGHLINAQMALKHRMAVMVDESLGAMNMPTRSELRTLQDRLQETRRENQRLRQDLAHLARHVAALGGGENGGETRALQSALVTTPGTRSAVPVKPAPARKKAVVKPTTDK